MGVARRAERPRPARDRRRPHGPARGVLAVQAVEPRGLPGGVRRGRPGARRAAARGAQARRDDRARPGAGGDDGGARPTTRTWPRSGAVYRRRRAGAAGGARAARATRSTGRTPGCTCGCARRPAARTAGRRSAAWPALGILVAPGRVLRRAAGHVRVALTAPDERIAEAAARLVGGLTGARRVIVVTAVPTSRRGLVTARLRAGTVDPRPTRAARAGPAGAAQSPTTGRAGHPRQPGRRRRGTPCPTSSPRPSS